MSSSKWLMDGRQFLAAQDQVRLLIGTLRRARGRATSRPTLRNQQRLIDKHMEHILHGISRIR